MLLRLIFVCFISIILFSFVVCMVIDYWTLIFFGCTKSWKKKNEQQWWVFRHFCLILYTALRWFLFFFFFWCAGFYVDALAIWNWISTKEHESRFASNDKDDLVWTRWILWLIKCHLLFFDYALVFPLWNSVVGCFVLRFFSLFFLSLSPLFICCCTNCGKNICSCRASMFVFISCCQPFWTGNKSYNAEINMYQLFRIGSIRKPDSAFFFLLLSSFFSSHFPFLLVKPIRRHRSLPAGHNQEAKWKNCVLFHL